MIKLYAYISSKFIYLFCSIVEFGLADPADEDWNDRLAQRILLRQRDSFYVPPGNVYRLENHSSTKTSVIYWTIIKALSTYHKEDADAANR